MEGLPSFEDREREIDGLIDALAERKGMNPDDILSDIGTFVPGEEDGDPHNEYLKQVAEMLGISIDEMIRYAVNKARDQFGE